MPKLKAVYPTTDTTLVPVPLYMLRMLKSYCDLNPKELSAMPTRVRVALDDLIQYMPKE